MTPESIPGLLIRDELELLFHPADIEDALHHGPAYQHHEPFLTDLPEAA